MQRPYITSAMANAEAGQPLRSSGSTSPFQQFGTRPGASAV